MSLSLMARSVGAGLLTAGVGIAASISVADMFLAILAIEAMQIPLLFNLHGRTAELEAITEASD